jgi:adenylate kinase family enzyme
MKRVVIVGCPGAGKSTFAKKLHERTGLPLVHLDFYHHQRQHNYYTDKPAWISRVKTLMRPEQWIIDGNYMSTIPERFRAADTIIFLDLPRWLCVYRVAKRRFHYRNKRRDDMPSDWTEKANIAFLKYVWHFNRHDKPKLVSEINKHVAIDKNNDKNHAKDVLIFHNSQDAERYLAQLENDAGVLGLV